MSPKPLAQTNFRELGSNPYPGRGLVIGLSELPSAGLELYWIMGRSENSRNRRFVADGTTLRTAPVDEAKLADPSLVIYEAMLELLRIFLVSNGDQTRTVYEALRWDGTFDGALATRKHEPDAPHYTPRITGMLDLRGETPTAALSLLRPSTFGPAQTDRYTYRPSLVPGFGYGLTTYAGDGNPLPSFSGDPLLLPLAGTAEEILSTYWDALNAENRVALALKHIPLDGGPSTILIRNQY